MNPERTSISRTRSRSGNALDLTPPVGPSKVYQTSEGGELQDMNDPNQQAIWGATLIGGGADLPHYEREWAGIDTGETTDGNGTPAFTLDASANAGWTPVALGTLGQYTTREGTSKKRDRSDEPDDEDGGISGGGGGGGGGYYGEGMKPSGAVMGGEGV